jgi:acyl-CoA synthetase (NDP forming)
MRSCSTWSRSATCASSAASPAGWVGSSPSSPSPAGGPLGSATDADLPADATLDALLTQAGVIKVSTLDLLFDVTRVLLTQPVPAGPRVAIVSNSSGPARLAVDACRGAGLVGAASWRAPEAAISDSRARWPPTPPTHST